MRYSIGVGVKGGDWATDDALVDKAAELTAAGAIAPKLEVVSDRLVGVRFFMEHSSSSTTELSRERG